MPPTPAANDTFSLAFPTPTTVSKTVRRVELAADLSEWPSARHPLAVSMLVANLGNLANHEGATLAAGEGWEARSISTQTQEFGTAGGEALTAVAVPVRGSAQEQTWRCQVFRHARRSRPGSDALAAEITQRFILVEKEEAPENTEALHAHSRDTSKDAADGTANASADLADRRRRQIFEGACEVIASKGWANASIRDIVKAAGITIPTMYQYIENKADILYLVTSMCMEEILTYFQDKLDDQTPPLDALVNAIGAYFQYMNKNRRYINLVYSETRSLNEANREKIFLLEKRFIRMWEEIIIRGNQAKTFDTPNTDLAANLIYFFCTAWALRHWSIGHYSQEEVQGAITRIILEGILAKPR